MKVLVADDAPMNCVALAAMLKKDGHEAILASDGLEAVHLFEREAPDLVIMDLMMPKMDGYEATLTIKKGHPDRFVPVIFLTAETDNTALARCIEVGGDDFLTKPFHPVILRAKLAALGRIRDLYRVVEDQNTELAHHHQRLLADQDLAADIMKKVLGSDGLDSLNMKHSLRSATTLNGDVLLSARSPTGDLYMMLGDFTGHGLSAAMGAMPAAEVFYRMTSVGYDLPAIATEMNTKLKRVLPTHLFCCACLAVIDFAEKSLSVWNGGLPDALVYSPSTGLRSRFISRHLPLGVLSPVSFDASFDREPLSIDDRIFLFTDGLIEAIGHDGQQFGMERVEHCLAKTLVPDSLFEDIEAELKSFTEGYPQLDDIALVELTGNYLYRTPMTNTHGVQHRSKSDLTLRTSFELGPHSLRTLDPLPEIMRWLETLDTLGDRKPHVFLILTELFSNALNHGVLGLESGLKQTPEGFARFYALREQRLTTLDTGHIHLHLEITPSAEGGGKILVRVEDSGPGFNFHWIVSGFPEQTQYVGRGIPLIRSLCEHVTYKGKGNVVEAVYAW